MTASCAWDARCDRVVASDALAREPRLSLFAGPAAALAQLGSLRPSIVDAWRPVAGPDLIQSIPANAVSHPMALDDTDRQLISLLRKDARMPVATLAAKLGVSRGTVTNRLRKLESEHVIVGYTLQLRPDAEPNQIRAWMAVLVDGNQTRLVMASLLGEPAVAALHDTNGRWDLLAELRAESMAELSNVLERIRLIKGIANTETSILLATFR